MLDALHLDGPLLLAVLAVCAAGLVVLFSAAGENLGMFMRPGRARRARPRRA